MQPAKRYPPSLPAHRLSEEEAGIWVMIVILLGLVCYILGTMFNRVAG